MIGYGTQPFSITRHTRRGETYFTAHWLPTSERQSFATKSEAPRWVKAHERKAYATRPR